VSNTTVSQPTNGNLTAARFEAAGLAVTETRPSVTSAVTVEFGANLRTKKFFEGAIAQSWRETAAGIMRVGRLLREAQEELDSETFKQLKLPFGQRTKQRLVAIAGNVLLATHVSQLPPHWGTQYELTKIPDQRLRELFSADRIHPGLERREAAAFLGRALRRGTGKKTGVESKEEPIALATAWIDSSREERREALSLERRDGLVEILPLAVLTDICNHVIAQQINLADAVPNDLRVTLTKIFRRIICSTDQAAVMEICAAFRRKCAGNNIDPLDLLITFPRGRRTGKRSRL
jgi:hypothetical protein